MFRGRTKLINESAHKDSIKYNLNLPFLITMATIVSQNNLLLPSAAELVDCQLNTSALHHQPSCVIGYIIFRN